MSVDALSVLLDCALGISPATSYLGVKRQYAILSMQFYFPYSSTLYDYKV